MSSKIRSLSIPIARKNVSYLTNTLAYMMAILPGIIYPAKFLNITLSEYVTLFQPLDKILRETTQVMSTIHRNQLYMRSSEAGLNLMDIVMQIQKLKQRMIKRAFLTSSPNQNATKAILERCYRQSVLNSSYQPLTYSEHIKSWTGSLI